MNFQQCDILQALCTAPDGRSQRDLAKASGCSLGIVNRSLQSFRRDGLIDESGRQTEKALQHLGASVVMTRREDVDLCTPDRPAHLTKKRQDMQNRIALAKAHQADMVLSIHMNEYRVRSESGPQVFYRAGCDSGRLLAGCVQEAMIRRLQPRKQRTAMAGDYFILQLDVPSALVECGFVSNPAEEKLLLDEAYQARIGEAVAEGVTEYIQLGQPQ